ncbi:MAG: AAA family ATPase [Victivallales bacterium]|nr:AAA family ATPase [Victivallales bacterium]
MIQELKLTNFTTFAKAHFKFGSNLNIIVGNNGSGKTHLLKAIYAMSKFMRELQKKDGNQFENRCLVEASQEKLKSFFSVFNVSDFGDLLNWDAVPHDKKITGSVAELSNPSSLKKLFLGKMEATIDMRTAFGDEAYDYQARFSMEEACFSNKRAKSKGLFPLQALPKCVFFPCRELLSIFPHYLALRQEFILPYDSTYDDTIGKLGMPQRNGLSVMLKSIIASLENSINGKIILKNERFYYHGKDMPAGLNWEIDMIAEGWRKIGMLLQLILDGSLREGAVLLWDEPEANLNPQLIQLIAIIIVELSKLDIQIFITTHSLFLLNELEIVLAQQKIKEGVRFFDLRKGKVPQQGNTLSALKNILLLDEDMKQSDRYLSEEV